MKQHAAWFVALSASLVLSGAATGCGDDTTSTPTGSGATGGTGGSGGGSAGTSNADAGNKAGSAGTGGAGGSSGSGGGGTAGTGGAADAGAFKCGTMVCTSIDIGTGSPLPPCCPTGETNVCGNTLAGLCLTSTPGTADPSCPDVVVPGQGSIPGCCTVMKMCGADLSPLGCNDLSGLLGGTPMACGGDAGTPPPQDSGTSDAPRADGTTTDGAAPDGTSTEGGSDAATDRAPDAPSDAKADQAG